MTDPSAIRQLVQNGILERLGAEDPPWQVSLSTWDNFPGADPDQLEALSFAVGLPSSSVANDGRQRGQIATSTIVGVRFASKIRADNQVADYDRALDREVRLVSTVRLIVGGTRAALVSIDRSVVGDGTVFVGDLRFAVFHGYPLRGA